MNHKKTKKECQEYYDTDSATYNKKRFSCDCQKIMDKITKDIVYDTLKSKNLILDAGTGTGRFAIHFAKKGHKVIALDSSKNMIKIAKESAKKENVEKRIKFVVADIEKMPIKSNTVDGVCSINVLVHLPNKRPAIAEFSRVLKRDGLCVFNIHSKPLQVVSAFRERQGWAFLNFPSTIEELKDDLKRNSIVFDDKIDFGIIPRLFLHIIFCKLKLNFLEKTVENIQKKRIGLHSIVVGEKK